ncbi:MAG: hypothetical protein HUJ57_02780 [Erysipelotrichaceae bacterium]|nr:hypothetical protein [Erysipelotrichaceae bacterium]
MNEELRKQLELFRRKRKASDKIDKTDPIAVIILICLIVSVGFLYPLIKNPKICVVYVIVMFSAAIAWIVFDSRQHNQIWAFDDRLCRKLFELGYDAETLMKIAEKYGLRRMLPYAVDVRCKELNIDTIPKGCFFEGKQLYRLPDEDDIDKED